MIEAGSRPRSVLACYLRTESLDELSPRTFLEHQCPLNLQLRTAMSCHLCIAE